MSDPLAKHFPMPVEGELFCTCWRPWPCTERDRLLRERESQTDAKRGSSPP
jgi:hypothetical protein